MTNFIPIFPLNLVVFPGEELNLHIFEPRYRQLVEESIVSKKPFGVPAVLNDKLQDMGSVVEIIEVSKRYENGELDIKTKATDVFRILEVIRELPEKLFSGAIVNYPENHWEGNAGQMKKIIASIREMHRSLKVEKDFHKPDGDLNSYDVAHHIGLSIEEEFELLGLFEERQRQEYLKRHLAKALPAVTEQEQLREKIKLNGHFKTLPGFEL
ncbi:MAG: peptidase S16 [Chitinophagaceae bacterium]|nr:MAG: peptidase S16 [Chitinophagaceae bacterium]